jgi:hypothetical protein
MGRTDVWLLDIMKLLVAKRVFSDEIRTITICSVHA